MTNFAEEAMSDPVEYSEGELEFYHGSMLHQADDPDDYITIHVTCECETTEEEDALHRKLGNVYPYPENGGNVCEADTSRDGNERGEQEHQQGIESS